jgi:hypothetical protein
MSAEWEHFDFNKDVLMNDDTKLGYFGGGSLIVHMHLFVLHIHFQAVKNVCLSSIFFECI